MGSLYVRAAGRNWVGDDLRVADVMTSNPLSVKEGDFATKARSLFRTFGYRSLPVVDEDNKLVGIVTRGDILHVTSTKSNILVRGLMSPPVVYGTPEEDLYELARKLLKSDVNRAPIVKSNIDMELIGIVCMHDILRKMREKSLKPHRSRVREVMTEKVVTCTPKDPLTKVWMKMDDMGFSGIPVVKGRKVVGIVTRKDILKAGYARIGKEDEKGKGKTKNPPAVEKIMRTPVISVSPDCSIEEATDLLLKFNIGRLAVVEDGSLVGIVDREDIIKAYLGD
jgi:CBS domain-containing protein